MYHYHERVRANFAFNPYYVQKQPTDPYLRQFDVLIDYGQDYEGYYVIRRSSYNGKTIRIDFNPPV